MYDDELMMLPRVSHQITRITVFENFSLMLLMSLMLLLLLLLMKMNVTLGPVPDSPTDCGLNIVDGSGSQDQLTHWKTMMSCVTFVMILTENDQFDLN